MNPEPSSLRVSDFDFELPPERIAQQPPAQRGASRMLILERAQNRLSDHHFHDFPYLLNPGDLLVLNDSRVIPARLFARKSKPEPNSPSKQDPTGQIEVLLTAPTPDGNWTALVRPGRKVRPGDTLEFFAEEARVLGTDPDTEETRAFAEGAGAFAEGAGAFAEETRAFADGAGAFAEGAGAFAEETRAFAEGAGAFRPLNQPPSQRGFSPGIPILRAQVLSSGEFGERTLQFAPMQDFYAALDQIGHIPLPPYIQRADSPFDRQRYQTVFAQERGSVAAPTAGLHFTPEILAEIAARGVEISKLTLHVGLGTFAPLRQEKLSEIQLHRERYTLPPETAQALSRARQERRRIVAVGTTAVRTLEHCAQAAQGRELQAHSGETAIFLSPGHQFQLVDALLTNFHLPKSSLLMLVSAFAGRERVLAAYRHAVQQKYRFFSYGDCMFLH